MDKKITLISIMIITFFCSAGCSLQQKVKKMTADDLAWTDEIIDDAVSQYKVMMQNLPKGVLPNSVREDGTAKNVKPTSWVAGFYPGTLLNLYMMTSNDLIFQEALERVELMRDQQFLTNHHDIGFMMYSSYGNLYKIDHREEYEKILINSAYSLSKRYNPQVESIRSWGDKDDQDNYIVIIDNMMNLELLFWASKKTGDKYLYDIAVKHANTTMKNHFRPDYSSYHVVEYDPKTGNIAKQRTAQGYSDDSSWARGQAWALYGFTMMFRETGDRKYLVVANGIANFILTHSNLPEDKVPYWDFNDPKIPNTYRDASAGAIIASALIELSKYNKKESILYFDAAETILRSLSSPDYRAEIGTNGGFILKHSVANLNKNTDVDAPLPYADYYFIEALNRYRNYFK